MNHCYPSYSIIKCITIHRYYPISIVIDNQLYWEIGTGIGKGSPGEDIDTRSRSNESSRVLVVTVPIIRHDIIVYDGMMFSGVVFWMREVHVESNDISKARGTVDINLF